MQGSSTRLDSTKAKMNGRVQEASKTPLPAHGLRFAWLRGIWIGLLNVAIPVGVTYMNPSLYREASRLGDKMPIQIAWTITEVSCTISLAQLLACFVLGWTVGRVAVLRRYGFLAGAIAGAITCLGGFLVHYIPNYPDKIPLAHAPSPTTILTGILTMIALTALYSLVGGLLALWGARIATRKHPSYQAQD